MGQLGHSDTAIYHLTRLSILYDGLKALRESGIISRLLVLGNEMVESEDLSAKVSDSLGSKDS